MVFEAEVNMRMASYAGAVVYLVADIERGGVFASVYGSVLLLSPEERALVKGIIINKFRGDINLFADGTKMLAELTGIPVVGVLPAFNDIYIDPEDSVVLQLKTSRAEKGKINIAIVAVKQLSNFTDYELLEKQPEVQLFYARSKADIEAADIVILPGSKSTIADLLELQQNGLAAAIADAYRQGKTVVGICGGYQMMGLSVDDPAGVESCHSSIAALGLLPVRTVLTNEKTTRQAVFQFKNYPGVCNGYEIHMGVTTAERNSPLAIKSDGSTDGHMLNHRCWGTYLHGIFDNGVVINDLLAPFRLETTEIKDMEAFKQEQYDKLAAFMRQHLNLDLIYKQISL